MATKIFWFLICYAATQLATQLHQRLVFWFLVCNASTQIQLKTRERKKVVRSNKVWFLVFGLLCRHTVSNPITAEIHTSGVQNKEARKRLTKSNGTPVMDLGHMNVVVK